MQQRVLTSLFLVGVGPWKRRKREKNSNRERDVQAAAGITRSLRSPIGSCIPCRRMEKVRFLSWSNRRHHEWPQVCTSRHAMEASHLHTFSPCLSAPPLTSTLPRRGNQKTAPPDSTNYSSPSSPRESSHLPPSPAGLRNTSPQCSP